MKLTMISTTVALTLLSGLAHAGTSCDDFNLTGKYRHSTINNENRKFNHTFKITQNGCAVTLVDYENNAKWSFDLSGVDAAKVPNTIIQANQPGGELALESLGSMRLKFETSPNYNFMNNGYKEITITGTSHLPAANDNKFDVDGVMKLTLWISSAVGRTTQDGVLISPSPAEAKQVSSIRFKSSEFRVAKVRDARLPGVIGKAFVTGANYVLAAMDKMGYSILHEGVELDRITEVTKK